MADLSLRILSTGASMPQLALTLVATALKQMAMLASAATTTSLQGAAERWEVDAETA